MFIVIEGLDSCGKATQSRILADRLRAQHFSFPRYNTTVGAAILRHLKGEVFLAALTQEPITAMRASCDPLAFQCMMLADKCLAAKMINNELARGHNVVCDRWIPSALCYGAADGVDFQLLHDMHVTLPKADLNIFLDVSPEEALRRRPEARDRYERDREKQKVVREHYARLWDQGGLSYVTVNGEGTDDGRGPIESVAERIWEVVRTMFDGVGR